MNPYSYYVTQKLEHITDTDRLDFLIQSGARLSRYKSELGVTKYSIWFPNHKAPWQYDRRPKDVIDYCIINYPIYKLTT